MPSPLLNILHMLTHFTLSTAPFYRWGNGILEGESLLVLGGSLGTISGPFFFSPWEDALLPCEERLRFAMLCPYCDTYSPPGHPSSPKVCSPYLHQPPEDVSIPVDDRANNLGFQCKYSSLPVVIAHCPASHALLWPVFWNTPKLVTKLHLRFQTQISYISWTFILCLSHGFVYLGLPS